jgi:hypothetical protein
MRQPFSHAPSVVLDAAGDGDLTLGPYSADKVIEGAFVETSTATLHPTCTISVNGRSVGGTYSGHRDNTVRAGDRLPAGAVLSCAWVGGDPGATATLHVWGMQYPPGQMP